ncbi:hypothetical protein K431DRAFT_299781 [Polychaeton citri CBS 116435]|uniref:Uncharacterized protein n=1 Tax=Polychaeton citri CBS 116435 TaxID=1314669 RepID=A0A9P4QFS3_9PEZI|nr:hypothetical protein K431DRAFT_299781 [Polychaeton citri CBS 116435]
MISSAPLAKAHRLARPLTTYLRTSTSNFHSTRGFLSEAERQIARETKVSSNYNAPPVPPRRGRNQDQLPVLPLVAIFCIGSLSFVYILRTREGQGKNQFNISTPAPANKEEWAEAASASSGSHRSGNQAGTRP